MLASVGSFRRQRLGPTRWIVALLSRALSARKTVTAARSYSSLPAYGPWPPAMAFRTGTASRCSGLSARRSS